jgi:hypothetical protein
VAQLIVSGRAARAYDWLSTVSTVPVAVEDEFRPLCENVTIALVYKARGVTITGRIGLIGEEEAAEELDEEERNDNDIPLASWDDGVRRSPRLSSRSSKANAKIADILNIMLYDEITDY